MSEIIKKETILTTKFLPYVDDLFKEESKTELLTSNDFSWSGHRSIVIFKTKTVPMVDYAGGLGSEEAEPSIERISRYGELKDLKFTTQEMLLKKDRSFIFNIDKLYIDDTEREAEGAKMLARQVREVVIPEVDTYCYKQIIDNAGTKANATAITEKNIYDLILKATEALDTNEVPELDRVLLVTPSTYTIMKKAIKFDNTPLSDELVTSGVIAMLDGLKVVKVPSNRLPSDFGFMVAHPCATVFAQRLENYNVHTDTPLSSGEIVTGRIIYDAFVIDNKAKAIYYQPKS